MRIHNRPDKKHEITEKITIGRDENGFNYFFIVDGVRVNMNELDLNSLGSKIEDLLYSD